MAVDRFSGVHASDSHAAVLAFEEAVEAIAAHRPDGADALQRCPSVEPDMVAAHALKGLAAVTLARPECLTAGTAAPRAGRAAAVRPGSATQFEIVLLDVLDHLLQDNSGTAVSIMDLELERDPSTFLLAKLSHSLWFMAGDQRGMLASTSRLLPHWSSSLPGYGYLLGCHAFALEENGHYLAADQTGRQAVDLEPRDAWDMHAVAHVYEMEGRTAVGIHWLRRSERSWRHCHNFRFHMAWHLTLFLLEERRLDEVLGLYDRAVRPVASDDFREVASLAAPAGRSRDRLRLGRTGGGCRASAAPKPSGTCSCAS